ncbi:MAG: PilT/PilU family type 4a pilus ATPase, partial [Planctomycetota bacterium]
RVNSSDDPRYDRRNPAPRPSKIPLGGTEERRGPGKPEMPPSTYRPSVAEPATPKSPSQSPGGAPAPRAPQVPKPAGASEPNPPLRADAPDKSGKNAPSLSGLEVTEQELAAADIKPILGRETPVNPAAAERLREASMLAERLSSTSMSPRHQIEAWLAVMVQTGASDLILRAGGRPSTRVDGRIGFLPGRVPGAGALLEVLEGVMGKDRMVHWRESGSVDSALQLDGLGRFRINAYRQMGEPAVVLRRVADQPPQLDRLELPFAELTRVAMRKRGLVLVTGIAGSGKSTTLAGMIQYMNTHVERHVVTLEDPIEMLFTEDRCVISQREVGIDCPTFQQGLRHALRQSPDVILIGEMRDQETVCAALDASETGHLVLSTMHTVNAAQTLDRILGFFPAGQHSQVRTRLGDNMACVLSQRLLPRAAGTGMVPAFELMTATPRIRELLDTGETGEIARTIEGSNTPGLISFNQSLRRLVQHKLVDLKDALAASDRPDELVLALRGITSSSGRGKDGLKMSQDE